MGRKKGVFGVNLKTFKMSAKISMLIKKKVKDIIILLSKIFELFDKSDIC